MVAIKRGSARTRADRALFVRLWVAWHDFHRASEYAGVILKKGWHHPPWFGRGVAYRDQSAYCTALVMTYCRPFTQSRGLPPLPPHVRQYKRIEEKLHKKVLRLRHQVYAHSDYRRHKVAPWAGNTKITLEKLPFLRLSAAETRRLQRMLSKIADEVHREVELVRARL